MNDNEHSPDAYISAHEYNFEQKIDNPQQFSTKEILDLEPQELQLLKTNELNSDQLSAAFRKSMILNYHSLAISFLKELRKYFEPHSGSLYVAESKIKIGSKKITIDGIDEKYDHYLHELAMNMEMTDKKEMAEKLIPLYFDHSSSEYNYALLLVAIHQKDSISILNLIEKMVMTGKDKLEYFLNIYYSLKEDFPGIALIVFRSIIAAFPYNSFDIDFIIDDSDTLEDDLSVDTYDLLCDYIDKDDIDIFEDSEIIVKLKEELNDAKKESSRQKKIVEKLKQQQSSIEPPHYDKSDKKNETELDNFKDQIIQGKKKIETLRGIIKNKQEAIKELKTRLSMEHTTEDQSLTEKEENHEIDFDVSTHTIPKITVPEYSNDFIKCMETEEPSIARKALESITGFTINDPKVMKQTKILKVVQNYYSVRIGIHHRLLIEYIQNRPPKAQYLIHRKDLEKYIKKIQQSK